VPLIMIPAILLMTTGLATAGGAFIFLGFIEFVCAEIGGVFKRL
jgi:hypothetical protein